jgi:hypothetical protein
LGSQSNYPLQLDGGGVINAATIVGIGICQAANDIWAHDGRGGKEELVGLLPPKAIEVSNNGGDR